MRINKYKWVRIRAIQALSGLAPQEKIEAILQNEIIDRGIYEKTAYEMMAMRAYFLHDMLIDRRLLDTGLHNAARVIDALEKTQMLDYLQTHPKLAANLSKMTLTIEPDIFVEGDEEVSTPSDKIVYSVQKFVMKDICDRIVEDIEANKANIQLDISEDDKSAVETAIKWFQETAEGKGSNPLLK